MNLRNLCYLCYFVMQNEKKNLGWFERSFSFFFFFFAFLAKSELCLSQDCHAKDHNKHFLHSTINFVDSAALMKAPSNGLWQSSLKIIRIKLHCKTPVLWLTFDFYEHQFIHHSILRHLPKNTLLDIGCLGSTIKRVL